MHQNPFDRWFTRAGLVIVVISSLATLYVSSFRYYSLPREVEAIAQENKEQNVEIIQVKATQAEMKNDITYIKTRQDNVIKNQDAMAKVLDDVKMLVVDNNRTLRGNSK